jgi:site-specific recombinase XerD
MRPAGVTHAFHETATTTGLKCRLHDLRHAYASHKAMAGDDLYTLKEPLGHQDKNATQIYPHGRASQKGRRRGRGRRRLMEKLMGGKKP